jgi:hypothetical protein
LRDVLLGQGEFLSWRHAGTIAPSRRVVLWRIEAVAS